jgi:hypothetical protein
MLEAGKFGIAFDLVIPVVRERTVNLTHCELRKLLEQFVRVPVVRLLFSDQGQQFETVFVPDARLVLRVNDDVLVTGGGLGHEIIVAEIPDFG